jgi:MarR family transcriptional regulator, 2-MHQ and catechol-resistance regulon repressor
MEISKEINTTFKSARQKAIVNIRFTSNWMSNLQNSYMNKFDLTMPQFNILRILRGAKDFLSVNTVKDRMIEKSPNTTRLMDKLIEKKLIERVRCEKDRRVVYVKITDLGLNVLDKIDDDFEESHLYSKKLTEEEAEQLSNLLDKIRS